MADHVETLRGMRAEAFNFDLNNDEIAALDAAIAALAQQAGAVDELIEEVQGFTEAYPEDVFPPLSAADRATHGHIIQRASAAMGRHMGARLLPKVLALRAPSAPGGVGGGHG